MFQFIIRRIIYGFFVLVGVLVVVFMLFNVLPGDPARMMLGQRADQESIKTINRDLGLDKPLMVQFIMYVNDLSPISVHNISDKNHYLFLDDEKYTYTKLISIGNNKTFVLKYPYLRRSYQSKRKVSEIINQSMPATAVLALSSMIIATILGIFFGIISAIKKGTFIDNFNIVFSVIGMSIPSFFAALIIAWIFGYLLSDYTGLNMYGSLYTLDDYGEGEYLDLKNLILPATTLGIRPLAVVVQLMRGSLLDVLGQDYIRTANAKGLSYYSVIVKHALKNALNPVITAISGWLAALMAGTVYIEMIFGWKGIGYETFKALEKYDFPVVMGTVLVTSTIFVFINIFVDIIYGILDPRARVK